MVFEFYQKAYEAKVNRVDKKYLRHTIYYCPEKIEDVFRKMILLTRYLFPNNNLEELYSDEN